MKRFSLFIIFVVLGCLCKMVLPARAQVQLPLTYTTCGNDPEGCTYDHFTDNRTFKVKPNWLSRLKEEGIPLNERKKLSVLTNEVYRRGPRSNKAEWAKTCFTNDVKQSLGNIDKEKEELIYKWACFPECWYKDEEMLRTDYKQDFTPNSMGFDKFSRPYIRSGNNIQTINKQGGIEHYDFIQSIKDRYPGWNDNFTNNLRREERTVLDGQGRCYMVNEIQVNRQKYNILHYSRDFCRTWRVYELPRKHPYQIRLEFRDAHNDPSPPSILAYIPPKFPSGRPPIPGKLELIIPTLDAHGQLSFSAPIPLPKPGVNDSLLTGGQAGVSNYSVTKNHLTHIVWVRMETGGPSGVPTYFATYDHHTRQVTSHLLGHPNTNEGPDLHYHPGITLDSKGRIHVVLGAHSEQFTYFVSKTPNPKSIAEWEGPTLIGREVQEGVFSGYTYVALVADSQDALHLIFHSQGSNPRLPGGQISSSICRKVLRIPNIRRTYGGISEKTYLRVKHSRGFFSTEIYE